MANIRDYRPITVFISFHAEEHVVTIKNEHIWNPHFMERLKDYQNFFEDSLMDAIDGLLGKERWAIYFTQELQEDSSWLVDLYADDPENIVRLKYLVLKKISSDFHFTFFLGGSVNDYLLKCK